MKKKLISNAAIIYFLIGLIFATGYAIYYRWTALAILSPGYFAVVLSWPIQIPGLIYDLQQYGLTGKPF
jgi:hypothetical protein